MFKELLPILQGQTLLTITLSAEGENMIRANIIPHQKQGEEAAMAQPLSILATAEELDAELPNVLTGFVEERTNLGTALADYKAQAEAAKKAAAEAAKNKTKTVGKASTTATQAAAAAVQANTSPTLDLFSTPAAAPATETQAETAPAEIQAEAEGQPEGQITESAGGLLATAA